MASDPVLPPTDGGGPLPGAPEGSDALLPGGEPVPPMPDPTPVDPEGIPLPGEPPAPGPDDAPGGPVRR